MQLIIQTDVARQLVQLSLRDPYGKQLGYHCLDLHTLAVSERRAMFDLGNFLHHYVAPAETEAAIEKVGVAIANKLLGEQIFMLLWQANTPRTLRIVLPAASQDEAAQNLSADLARVPWESARLQRGAATLAEKNLSIQLQHQALASSASQPLQLTPGETLRVLFVFAEAQGSQPLGMRRERRELLALFQQEIYPQRKVSADYLMHGVTRQRLQAQIAENGGYHIIHWSGHGGPDVLELSADADESPQISGAELVALLQQAGGYLPQLFFLSACDSGAVQKIQNWQQFADAVLTPEQANTLFEAAEENITIPRPAGFTGTAHALLQAGVPAVVAMRYAVGDAYARALAQAFYRALLAHEKPENVAQALNLARRSLQEQGQSGQKMFYASDAATSVLFGGDAAAFCLTQGRSPAADRREPRLHEIAELHLRQHASFVGRSFELASLGAHFLGMGGKAVAVIKGLGGMGKSALCAEVVDVWQAQFTWILLYQAKPQALAYEATLRDIHLRLKSELGSYQRHIEQIPEDAIHREADDNFNGEVRLQRLRQNLMRAMQAEAILLVLDNFETNLTAQPNSTGQWNCQDPAWDACLALLAQELPGSGSRVLLTCRRPIAALPDARCHNLALGPLSAVEAALYLSEHPVLSAMAFGEVAEDWELAQRLLAASRFHPLLMDRLARLSAQPELREQLLLAINTLEERASVAQLPELFAGVTGDFDKELAYLEDALEVSLDQLIAHVGIEARRLLWVISVANEPVELGLLTKIWNGEAINKQGISKLLPNLVSIGLCCYEKEKLDTDPPRVSCHELVRERIRTWLLVHEQEREAWSESLVRLKYADQLSVHFKALQYEDMSAALKVGSRAIVYCVQIGDFEKLRNFASGVINGRGDPRLLLELLPHLKCAVEAAPEGKPRWTCLCYLASALREGGHPDASLQFYRQAIAMARDAVHAGGEGKNQAKHDLGWISANTANALSDMGKLAEAHEYYLSSAEIEKQRAHHATNISLSELEALRIDIMKGKAEQIWPQLHERLKQAATLWHSLREEFPAEKMQNRKILARTYLSALDIAKDIDFARQDWQTALLRLDAMLEVECEIKCPPVDIATTRMNRAIVLRKLLRFDEARDEMESCLPLFQQDSVNQARVFGSLASLYADQNDIAQAITQERRALALCEDLPFPTERVASHNNLANFLDRSASAPAREEASYHRIASLTYCLVSALDLYLQILIRNYAIDLRNAQLQNRKLSLPLLADLLTRPDFNPLKSWLNQHDTDLVALQTEISDIHTQAQQLALSNKSPTTAPV